MAEYTSLKVPELRKALSDRGLVSTGNKAELITRLTDADKNPAATTTAAAPKPGMSTDSSLP